MHGNCYDSGRGEISRGWCIPRKKASWKKGRGLSVMLTCAPNSWQCLPQDRRFINVVVLKKYLCCVLRVALKAG